MVYFVMTVSEGVIEGRVQCQGQGLLGVPGVASPSCGCGCGLGLGWVWVRVRVMVGVRVRTFTSVLHLWLWSIWKLP